MMEIRPFGKEEMRSDLVVKCPLPCGALRVFWD